MGFDKFEDLPLDNRGQLSNKGADLSQTEPGRPPLRACCIVSCYAAMRKATALSEFVNRRDRGANL